MTKNPFSLFQSLIKAYPLKAAFTLGALLLAGVVETIGIGALLPLLNVILQEQGNQEPNNLSVLIENIFNFFGLELSFQNLLGVIVVTITLKAVIIFQAMKMVSFTAADITKDTRVNLIKALMAAKWEYFGNLPIGQSSNAIASESEYAGHYFIMMSKTIAAVIQTIFYALIAFVVDWRVSLMAIIIGAIAAFFFKFFVRKARESGVEMAESLKNLLKQLNESLMGVKPLKAMGESERFISLLEKNIIDVNNAKKSQYVSNLSLNGFHEPIIVIFIAIGFYWAHIYASYPMTELLLIAFLFYRLISQINLIQNNYQKTANHEGAVQSVLKATKIAQDNVEVISGAGQVTLSRDIAFKDFSFSYQNNPVFTKFNATLPAHKMSVIFGPSGIGKSTLIDSILGFLAPQEGQILIDDTPIAAIDILKWRHTIGYVPQETFLFHDSVFANITLGDERITEDQVCHALKLSNALSFVESLEGGLHHIVGERGGKLSGGQRQRISMARALVRVPKLLILDEATTGLDKESENEILNALQNMLPDITIIAISHDPHILDIADHVIHLEKTIQKNND